MDAADLIMAMNFRFRFALLLAVPLLAGCEQDRAAYMIDDNSDHALTLQREVKYPWSDKAELALVVARFPEIAQSGVYARVSEWVARWGVWALFVATVIPLPQTPALAVCAIAAQPLPLAFIALLAGKGLRYFVYAWLAAKSPETARKISARYGLLR